MHSKGNFPGARYTEREKEPAKKSPRSTAQREGIRDSAKSGSFRFSAFEECIQDEDPSKKEKHEKIVFHGTNKERMTGVQEYTTVIQTLTSNLPEA